MTSYKRDECKQSLHKAGYYGTLRLLWDVSNDVRQAAIFLRETKIVNEVDENGIPMLNMDGTDVYHPRLHDPICSVRIWVFHDN